MGSGVFARDLESQIALAYTTLVIPQRIDGHLSLREHLAFYRRESSRIRAFNVMKSWIVDHIKEDRGSLIFYVKIRSSKQQVTNSKLGHYLPLGQDRVAAILV